LDRFALPPKYIIRQNAMVPVRFRLFFFSLGAAVYSTPDAPSPSIPLVHGQGLCAAGFNDKNSYLLQVVYRATALLRSWSPLQRLEDRDLCTEVSTLLENTAKEFISQHGWQHNRRLQAN
jgi:hypothetical protein